ncbi:hypothetical protein SAMN05216350_103449 [Polaromonas sp. YR568]|uniref:hypothetical protein n=1 Tax=Polaromonas sp. YR568 TaxID=1855301 RepID=UPI0008F04CFC|nr:hypothetical protein [Polaromonas sp. YR568]SFU66432.1 hypothetical protein SAMN05216350_103449 [Polaromonas sp. YR568]
MARIKTGTSSSDIDGDTVDSHSHSEFGPKTTAPARQGSQPHLRKAFTGALLLTLALASGCANNYLYSSTRDKQGAAAQTAWKAVDLKPLFAKERANQVRLLKEEQANQDALGTTERDLRLRIIASHTPLTDSLEKPIRKALIASMGSDSDPPEVASWQDLQGEANDAALNNEQINAYAFVVMGLEPPSCEELIDDKKDPIENKTPDYITEWKKGAIDKDKTQADFAVSRYRDACKPQKEFEKKLNKAGDTFKNGRVHLAWTTHERDRKKLDEMKITARNAQNAYKSAKKAYVDAVDAAEGAKNEKDKTSAQEGVDKAKALLVAAVDKLDHLPDPISRLFLSKEKVASLQEFIASLTDSTETPTTKAKGKIAAAAVLFPKIIDDANAALAAARKPMQTPLLIARDGFELKAKAAAKDLAAQEAVVKLSRAIFDTELARMEALRAANAQLHDTTKVPAAALKLHLTAAETKYPSAAETIEFSVLKYLDAVGALDARKLKLEYARWDAFSERKVAYAEDAAAQWQSLINTTVAQLAAYHEEGWTTEKSLAPINSALLLLIGLRGN